MSKVLQALNRRYSSDDEILLDLLDSNIRRCGEVGGSAKKVGKKIKELERLYGVRSGSANEKGTYVGEKISFTQESIAKKMDMDVRTLQNYKMLADMIQNS